MKVPNFYIEDMLEAIELIYTYLKDMREDVFLETMEIQDAVIRRLTIIGEAASKVPKEIKEQWPTIPWITIVAFRNVAIHEYPHVSIAKIWSIYQHDLPPLKKQLTKLLASLPPPPDPSEL